MGLDDVSEARSLFFVAVVVDYIKGDVQGMKLLVFQSRIEMLKQASFVHFEASTVEYNAGSSFF
jgi:hypothetical protein